MLVSDRRSLAGIIVFEGSVPEGHQAAEHNPKTHIHIAKKPQCGFFFHYGLIAALGKCTTPFHMAWGYVVYGNPERETECNQTFYFRQDKLMYRKEVT